jgi:hypothetical protein
VESATSVDLWMDDGTTMSLDRNATLILFESLSRWWEAGGPAEVSVSDGAEWQALSSLLACLEEVLVEPF